MAKINNRDDRTRIARQEMKEALLHSGYLLETRVASLIDRNGFFGAMNVAFLDPETKKSRELDLYAEYKGVFFHSQPQRLYVTVNLIVEVINNPIPVVFLVGMSADNTPTSRLLKNRV
jgi:hypothetical protein